MSGASTAFLFPGQGSQFPGMGREVERLGSPALGVVARAEEVTGLPVSHLMSTADARSLADPEIAQVLVFVWSAAALTRLHADGWRPDYVAGHSLGEFTALYAAGCLDLDTALRLVSCRGRAMRVAARVSPGSMAAIVGLPLDLVRRLCREAGEGTALATVANINSRRQTVISGSTPAVGRVVEQAQALGALRARQLPVGGAYHSPLMASALAPLAAELSGARLTPPRTPLVSSTTGQVVEDIEEYHDELPWQMLRPVQWRRTVTTLRHRGVDVFVESGPGRVLAGLGREIAREAVHLSVQEALRTTPGGPARPAADTPMTTATTKDSS